MRPITSFTSANKRFKNRWNRKVFSLCWNHCTHNTETIDRRCNFIRQCISDLSGGRVG